MNATNSVESTVCDANALYKAAQEIFDTMILMPIKPVEAHEESLSDDSLLGTITFLGKDVEGALTIRCDEICATAMTANMLGEEPGSDYSFDEVGDTVREISNMLMGSIKGAASGSLAKVQVSIPTLTSGHDFEQNLGEDFHDAKLLLEIDQLYPAELTLLWRDGE